mgnify:CR=1 FL=1
MSNFTKSQVKTAESIISATVNASADPYDAENRLKVLSNLCKQTNGINLPKKVKICVANMIDLAIMKGGIIDAAKNA